LLNTFLKCVEQTTLCMNSRPYSSLVLSLAGLILAGLGLYFIFLRPELLPEDFNYMGTSSQNVRGNVPGLFKWLQKVFWVMGGYIFSTGLLTVFISFTSFRKRSRGVVIIVAITGMTSIGLMSGVNFLINSDFKWVLLAFTLPWIITLILYKLHK